VRWETTCLNIRVRPPRNSRHPISSILQHRFSAAAKCDLACDQRIIIFIVRDVEHQTIPAFRTGPATTSFGGRTTLSGQTKLACNTNAFRRNSVDVSPSTSVEVVELVVKFRILGHSVRHIVIL